MVKEDVPVPKVNIKRPSGYAEIVKTFGKPDLPGQPHHIPLKRVKVPDSFKRHPYLSKGTLSCHVAIAPLAEWVFAEIERRGLSSLVKSYDGCYNPRFKRGGKSPSAHSWGIAFDINAGDNRMGSRPKLDRRIVAVFEEAGFFWGGRWEVPDGMHMQWCENY